jgi:hypothetical protein
MIYTVLSLGIYHNSIWDNKFSTLRKELDDFKKSPELDGCHEFVNKFIILFSVHPGQLAQILFFSQFSLWRIVNGVDMCTCTQYKKCLRRLSQNVPSLCRISYLHFFYINKNKIKSFILYFVARLFQRVPSRQSILVSEQWQIKSFPLYLGCFNPRYLGSASSFWLWVPLSITHGSTRLWSKDDNYNIHISDSIARWMSSRPLSSNVAVLKHHWPWKICGREWP